MPPNTSSNGTLFVVATPIGNLDDLTPRAVDVLSRVPLVLCEDTRHSGGLLRHLGAAPRTASLHAHNEQDRIHSVLQHLQSGADAALVSDAGTPCLSDPGVRLVDAVQSEGLSVVSVPGPFAGAVALAGAGLCTSAFSFWGFLPKKSSARRSALVARLAPGPDGALHSHLFYVPGRDVPALCDDIEAIAPAARIAVARELTKIHEGYVRGNAAEVRAALSEEMRRGEAVVIIEVDADTAAAAQEPPSVDSLLSAAITDGEDRKTALRRIAKLTSKGRRQLYARWTELASTDLD